MFKRNTLRQVLNLSITSSFIIYAIIGLETGEPRTWSKTTLATIFSPSVAQAESDKENQNVSINRGTPEPAAAQQPHPAIIAGSPETTPANLNSDSPPKQKDIGEYMSPHLSPAHRQKSSEYDDTSFSKAKKEEPKRDNYSNEYFDTLRKQRNAMAKELEAEKKLRTQENAKEVK